MKKVFLVKRKSGVNYDEYDSCVIVADDVDEVNFMLDHPSEYYKKYGTCAVYWDKGIDDREIIEIDLSTAKSGELCSSFNAG